MRNKWIWNDLENIIDQKKKMLCWIFILGICSSTILNCGAEESVRYQERGNVQFVPIATTPSPQAAVENDIKIMKEQINSLLKQRDYDRYLSIYFTYT